MQGADWRILELAVSRLLLHCGWSNIQHVGQSGDKGADILAVKENSQTEINESYLFQVKAIKSDGYVGVKAIEEGVKAQLFYRTKIVVICTNGDFTRSAYKRRDELKTNGFDVRLWNGTFLNQLIQKAPLYLVEKREPRSYQAKIINAVIEGYINGRSKSLFIVATGLGKTVIASSIADALFKKGLKRILVLCHATDLAFQLQKSFWAQLTKDIPTRIFMGGEAPVPIDGINFGLYQTLFNYLGGIDSDAFDLVIVDEAHHALANAFESCLNHLTPKLLIGMTATPWRGDGRVIESLFGEPIEKISLVDGMKLGYLAKVDYRLMCDNINWEEIPSLAKKPLSIRDLNKRLFLPQRDDAVIQELVKLYTQTPNSKIAVFSPSIEHADLFARKLVSHGIVAANLSIDDKLERRKILLDFSVGKLKALTAVDVLNEGIDVPDVNILVFLRATHSRRIFVQQLGRGLRLSPNKEKVIVLDFVTDIRRLAAVIEIDQEAKTKRASESETLVLREGVVVFSDKKVQSFVEAWLSDVADLQDKENEERLSFPEI